MVDGFSGVMARRLRAIQNGPALPDVEIAAISSGTRTSKCPVTATFSAPT